MLSSLKTGITRLREKGGAAPTSLYDAVNGYIDQSGAPTSRPGVTFQHQLPPGTRGACVFKGKRVVFSHTVVEMTDDDYRCITLRHPTDPEATIRRIWFAQPYAGSLYVSAQFDDDSIYHYWAEEADVWEAETMYRIGDVAAPSVASGLVFTAGRALPPNVTWSPDTRYSVGDKVEPLIYNGFYYEAVATTGTLPASSSTEPRWPTVIGGQVLEVQTVSPAGSNGGQAGSNPPPSGTVPPPYTNPGGSTPPSQPPPTNPFRDPFDGINP